MLNASKREADIEIVLYFEDRGSVGPHVKLGAQCTLHLRFNDLKNSEPVPRDTSYSSVIVSTVPIVVQQTRLDSRHPNIAPLSTTAYHGD